MIAAIVNVVSKFEPFIIKIDGGVLNVGIDQLHIALQQHIALKRCDTKCIEIDTVLKSVVARRLPYRCVLVRLPEPQRPLHPACAGSIAYRHSRSTDRNTEKCKTVNSSIPASLLISTDILLLML
jgi:hypothetical protein